MRRRLQSPLFPLFQVHMDRWIPNTLQILCSSETIHHLYICRSARCFLSALRRLCTNSASYEYKYTSASNVAQLVPIGMPIVSWHIRPPNTTKILSISYSSIFMTFASEYRFLWCIRVIPNEVCVFVANDNILKATVTIFIEETLVDNFL